MNSKTLSNSKPSSKIASESIFTAMNCRNYAMIWGSLTVALCLFSYFFYSSAVDSIKEELSFNQKEVITEVESLINTNLSWLARDIDLLSETITYDMAQTKSATVNRDALIALFVNTINTRPRIYDQIRFLAMDGEEMVRVNNSSKGPYVVPKQELQNKGSRYYFSNSLTLDSDEAYLSPLDLNVENSIIERPFNPVIRIAKPVKDKLGNTLGVLVLNQSEKGLLDDIRKISQVRAFKFWLVNSAGYWMLSHTPEHEWGFMLPGKIEQNMPDQLPHLWQIITQAGPDGRVRTREYNQGLISYLRLGLAQDEWFNARLTLHKEDAHWFLISISSDTEMESLTKPMMQRYLLALVFIWLVLGLMSLWIVLLMARRRRALLNLKESEAEMTSIFEHSPNAVVICNEQGLIELFNQNAEKEFGYLRQEVIGQRLDMLLPESLREMHKIHMEKYSQEPARRAMGQGRSLAARHKSGNTFPVKISLNHMVSTKGNYVIADVINISEEQELKKIQLEQEQLLIQQSKMAAMGQMLSAIAHQWRQPIAIIGALMMNLKDVLESRELSKKEVNSRIAEVDRKLQFMSQTIEDFRSFFRPDKMPTEFSVVGALAKAYDFIYPRMVKQKIQSEFKLKTSLEEVTISSVQSLDFWQNQVLILGSATEFIQVMLNLVTNAVDAIEERNAQHPETLLVGKIIVSVIQEADLTVRLSVEDNGCGLPQDEISNIFTPYYSNKESGIGLGLYISKLIIEKTFNGHIEAVNTPTGAKFTVVLPKQ